MKRLSQVLSVLVGPVVFQRSQVSEDNLEYRQLATTLFALYALGLTLLPLFAARAWLSGEKYHALFNTAVLAVAVGGYIYTRITGSLQLGTYLVISALAMQFASDFISDTNRAMWALTISVLSFFLLGERAGALVASSYSLLLSLLGTFLDVPRAYSRNFKVRFFAIYGCMFVISWIFEHMRKSTHNQLLRSRTLNILQRNIVTALASATNREEILQRTLEFLCTVPPLDCGGVYLIDPRSGGLRLVAHRGLSPAFVTHVSEYGPDDPRTQLIKKGIAVYRTHQTLGMPVADETKAEGLRALAVIPIVTDKVIGAVNVASHTEDAIPNDIRTMLEATAADIGAMFRRLEAVEELRALSSRYDAILHAIPDIIMEVDNRKVYTWANKAGYEFFGDDVIGKEASCYFVGEQETYRTVAPIFEGHKDITYVESWQKRKDGEARLLAWWCRPLRDSQGNVIGAISTARDITEIRRLQEQLTQAQKMEAVGQLAGGIAHDFNNQLGVVIGFAELLKRRVEHDEKLRGYAERVLSAAHRAADLTSRLLAFARKGTYQVELVDLHRLIDEVVAVLRQTIDRRIRIVQELAAVSATVKGDATQLQTALLNLALNARDAMPEGGTLTFATQTVDIDESYCRSLPFELPPGTYIQLRVKDTGYGMSPEVLKHVFEPFFTTKPVGKGTGMGLSAVYGIVKAHKGAITVRSEPQRGAEFTILLPSAYERVGQELAAGANPPEEASAKRLRILVVDDEAEMRDAIAEILRELSHQSVGCTDGYEAVKLVKENAERFDVIMLDMNMPGLSGRDTFRAIRDIVPTMPILLLSGYTSTDDTQLLLSQPATEFVQKPFSTRDLVTALTNLLSGHHNPTSA